MFNPSILELESQIQYHQEQQELAEQELDRLKMTQAFAEDAAEKVEEALEHIDPKYVDVFREHLLSLFPVETPHYIEEQETNAYVDKINSYPIPTKVKSEPTVKEDPPKTRAKLLGIPDFTPDTFEDLAPNITYSSSGRAYVGFNNRQQAEEFRERLEMPSMLDKAQIMNNHKWEVKFYCDRSYIEELLHQLHNDNFEQDEDWTPEQKAELDWQEQLVRIAPNIFYDPSKETCYLGFSAKGRADTYGSYLSRILNIAEKYIVTNKPRVTTNTKYELKLEAIAEEDAKHLAKFNLKKDYDHPDHKEVREIWRTTRKREIPPACKPLPRSIPIDEIKLGEIVSVGTNSKQYKVLDKVELDGIPHLEVIATYNSEMPALVGKTSYLKEVYRVLKEDIHVNSKLEESKSDLSFPAPPYKEIPLDQIELCDVITTSPNSQSAYEVTGNKGTHLLATCLYNKSLPHREGQKDFWIKEAYLVQKASISASTSYVSSDERGADDVLIAS